MAEYHRTETHQFCDDVQYMVLDCITGKPQRAFNIHAAIGPLEEAIEYVKYKGDRYYIVQLHCIRAFKF